jgi:hypothetical protein
VEKNTQLFASHQRGIVAADDNLLIFSLVGHSFDIIQSYIRC